MLSLASASFGLAAPVMSTNPDAPIKLGVNGFGRQVVRIAMERDSFVLKHINSPMSPEYMKYLLEHDTVHGRFKGTCEITDTGLTINGLPVSLSATRDPTEIPWSTVGVDYVCESTGAFTTTEGCMKHIEGGAKKVIISAPAKDADTPTLVVGVNSDDYTTDMAVVSCASCTTNGLAPLVKTINEKFGIKQGLMTTVHAATASQLTVDDRGEAVGGARRARHDGHRGLVLVLVDADHQGRGLGVLGGRRDDDVLGAALDVLHAALGGGERAGRLADVVDANRGPRDLGRVAGGRERDRHAVDGEAVVGHLAGAGEAAVHGVVLEQVLHVLRGHGRVDVLQHHRLTVHGNTHHLAADAAEAVDAKLDR